MNEDRDEALDPDEARALRALQSAERLEPPADLAPSVMRQLSAPPNVLGDSNPAFWSPNRRRQSSRAYSIASRNALLGVAAVALLAIGYFAVTGFPPTGPGSEATIGAGKKDQSGQISAKDAKLPNLELQRLLQSDSFRKLVSNPETRAILASKEFQRAISTAEVQALVGKAAEDPALQKLLAEASRDEAFATLRADAAFQAAIKNDAFLALLADPSFSSAIGDRSFLDAVSSAVFLEAARSGALEAAIENATDAAQPR
jgi:hypothetical protein